MKNKVFENPTINDKVTVLVSPEETGYSFLLVEVELAPGGGTGVHYHTTFDEEFIGIEGVVGIDLGKRSLRLLPGQRAIARKNQLHRFYNPGTEHVRFQVKITPGVERFLQALSIMYGLARDGQCNKKGLPKKFDHLAVVTELSDTRLPGLLKLIEPFILRRAVKAKKKGIERELLEKYYE